MRKIRLATVWLDGCSGCHMSLLDLDEDIEAVARKADLVYGPLVDAQSFPEHVDVTLVEGAVSSEEDREKAQIIRERSKLVVALGDCSVTGNVPAMRNTVPVKALLDRVYIQGAENPAGVPAEGVPKLLKRAVPLQEIVKVDFHLPGCPPPSKAIAFVVGELLEGRMPELGSKVKFG